MNDHFHFAILAVGITYIITDSAIFAIPRALIKEALIEISNGPLFVYGITLLYCPACMGAWIGLAVSPLFPKWPWYLCMLTSMLLNKIWSRFLPGTAFETEVLHDEAQAKGSHGSE